MNYEEKYLQLLAEKYPTAQDVCREIINSNAILNLPKGTEHFMSDIHGEYEAFCHIMNNCSGVIKEKVDLLFSDRLSERERQEICTLVYYPREKLALVHEAGQDDPDWYRMTLNELIEIAKLLSSKYTRSKVRKALPKEFGYIIDELIHAQSDEDDNQVLYHEKILDTIIRIDNCDAFIVALADLIKRLAVDHLHIVGDIFDRGSCADRILDLLLEHHSLDIEWGNHDILWMGAACGSTACIANVIRNNIKYHNMKILENKYGISLLNLTLFAEKNYPEEDPMDAAYKAISVILFKLEGQLIARHPEFGMDDRRLLHHIDFEAGEVAIEGRRYPLDIKDFPTVDAGDPYALSKEERAVVRELKTAFCNSTRLQEHIQFLYDKGGMYLRYNNNLLYHGCVPLDSEGNLDTVVLDGVPRKGKSYFDYADKMARKAFSDRENQDYLDFMWYLWCGKKSPLSGRNMKTFERTFIKDKSAWKEEVNPYYTFYYDPKVCNMILREFEIYSPVSHIINGHTPVKTVQGEEAVRAGGKVIVIDGGFCEDYHETTGIAGYTLIFNSHGMRIKAHQPFTSVQKVLEENIDIESSSSTFETEKKRLMVADTDDGKRIANHIEDLEKLLSAYRSNAVD